MNNIVVRKYEVWFLYDLNLRYARNGFCIIFLNLLLTPRPNSTIVTRIPVALPK